MTKILVTPQGFNFVKDHLKEFLNPNFKYIYTNGIVSNKEDLKKILFDCNAVIIGSETIDSEVIDSAPLLKCVVRFGTSTENIDSKYLKEKNISLHKIESEFTSKSVARLCLAYSLNYIYNINKHFFDSKNKNWKRYLNIDPSDTNIGLIGSGKISKLFFEYGSKMGFTFSYHSRSKNSFFDNADCNFYSNVDDLIKQSKIISVHLPLNNKTKNFISKKQLSLLKDKLLINTSRAEIIDNKMLHEFINKYPNFTYYTDVLKSEPPDINDLDLISKKNVFSTAHIGGYTKSALIDVARISLKILDNEL